MMKCVSRLLAAGVLSRLSLTSVVLLFLLSWQLVCPKSIQAEIDGRIGHIALPTVGRDTGITHIELFPYHMIEDEAILFGDLRGFINNDGKVGGNFGAGFRFLEPNEIFVFGLNGFYDVDQTSGKVFHQLGFGLEALTRFGSLTSNFYFPVGNGEQNVHESRSNARFEGHHILFDRLQVHGEALRGVDVMLGVFLPGEFARNHHMELSAGWYQFQGDRVDNINGFKIQLDGEIIPTLDAQVAVTSDDYFGSKVTLGISWRFGNRELQDNNLERQLRSFVDRNYNIVVGEWKKQQNGIQLTDANGDAYVVQHVSYASLSGDGTYDSPFTSVADAQTAGADIIFVHGDTTLNESIYLTEGQMLLGAGTEHQLVDGSYGRVTLPQSVSTGAMPTLLNIATNSIVMEDNTRVSGFRIENTGSGMGSGIVASGISDFEISDIILNNLSGDGIVVNDSANGVIRNITIEGGSGHGLNLTHVRETLSLENIFIDGVAQNGVHIEGGEGEIRFTGDLIINNVQGDAFYVTGLTTTETVDDKGTTDTSDDETTVSEGAVIVDSVVIDGADGGNGLVLENNDGFIAFSSVDITTTNGTAISAVDTDRFFIGTGSVDATGTTGVTGINLDNSLVDLRLLSLDVDGGTNAIRMIDTDGRLIVFGDSTAGSGGTIQNTDVAVEMEGSGQIGLQLMSLKGNKTIAEIENSTHFEMGHVVVTETENKFIDALNLQTLSISYSDFKNNAGMTADTGITYAVDKTSGFIFRFENNIVTEGPRRLLHATTLPGGESASLNYTFIANHVVLDQVNDVGTDVDWTGIFQGEIRNNLIQAKADNQTGFRFNFGDSTANTILLMQQNGIGMSGAYSTAIEMTSAAPLTTQLNQNLIQFEGLHGVGMRISTTKASTISISQNQIDDLAGGATGILLPTIYDGSSIMFNGNLINLSASDAFVDQGFILNAVGGTDNPTVQLISNTNNVISGASTIFSVPTTNVSGRLLINGSVIQ